MNITEIRIYPINQAHLKAYVSIIIEDCFMVRHLKIVRRGNSGLFLAMPTKKQRNGKFKDIAHPLNKETRRKMEEIVLSAYKKQEDKITKVTTKIRVMRNAA